MPAFGWRRTSARRLASLPADSASAPNDPTVQNTQAIARRADAFRKRRKPASKTPRLDRARRPSGLEGLGADHGKDQIP
jgi:hypothetical protein